MVIEGCQGGLLPWPCGWGLLGWFLVSWMIYRWENVSVGL